MVTVPTIGDRSHYLSREVEEFISWLATERGRSLNTLSSYRRDIGKYETFLSSSGIGIKQASPELLVSFVHSLLSEGLKPTTVARHVAAIRGLYSFLEQEGYMTDNPARHLRRPILPRALPKALDEQEVQKLIESAKGRDPVHLRDTAILEVLYGTGMRISELVGVCLNDIDWDGSMVVVMGKGRRERLVPLGKYSRQALLEWIGPNGRQHLVSSRWTRNKDKDAVFLSLRGRRLTRQGVWCIVRHYGELTGMTDRLTPHVLRHSCATHMLEHGADIRIVQELLGHVSIATTQVYTKVSAEHLRYEYEKAHPRASGLI